MGKAKYGRGVLHSIDLSEKCKCLTLLRQSMEYEKSISYTLIRDLLFWTYC